MTKEEAIEILKSAIKKPNTQDGYLGQALTMGIEALENSIDYRDLDDTIMRLNEQGWEITRYEYKRIEGVLFEMKQIKELNNEWYYKRRGNKNT